MSTKDEDFQAIHEIVTTRFGELGIARDKVPAFPFFRLILDIALEFFGEQEEDAQEQEAHGPVKLDFTTFDVAGMTFDYRIGMMGPYPGRVIIAMLPNKEPATIGFVVNGEEGLFIYGHRVKAEFGKLVSRHEDDSICKLQCHNCHQGNISLIEADNEVYCVCQDCGVETPAYQDANFAIAAFLVGKMEVRNAQD